MGAGDMLDTQPVSTEFMWIPLRTRSCCVELMLSTGTQSRSKGLEVRLSHIDNRGKRREQQHKPQKNQTCALVRTSMLTAALAMLVCGWRIVFQGRCNCQKGCCCRSILVVANNPHVLSDNVYNFEREQHFTLLRRKNCPSTALTTTTCLSGR